MKLIRYGEVNKEKPGVCIDDKYYDVSLFIQDYNEAFFANGGLPHLAWMIRQHRTMLREIPAGSRIGSPVARPSKIVCVGLNYADHAKEIAVTSLPAEPVIFLKATSAWNGPYDDIIIPDGGEKVDWEVELSIVIEKKAANVTEADALNYVAGYCLFNDVTERAFQMERGGTWDKGKGCDTFAPIGPWLVTKDELQDTNNLRLWLTVNGTTMQDGTTANLIFPVPFLVAYISRFMTLLPGDIISTGTPAGIGMGKKPSVFLRAGDVMELGIDGLGVSRQVIKNYIR